MDFFKRKNNKYISRPAMDFANARMTMAFSALLFIVVILSITLALTARRSGVSFFILIVSGSGMIVSLFLLFLWHEFMMLIIVDLAQSVIHIKKTIWRHSTIAFYEIEEIILTWKDSNPDLPLMSLVLLSTNKGDEEIFQDSDRGKAKHFAKELSQIISNSRHINIREEKVPSRKRLQKAPEWGKVKIIGIGVIMGAGFGVLIGIGVGNYFKALLVDRLGVVYLFSAICGTIGGYLGRYYYRLK